MNAASALKGQEEDIRKLYESRSKKLIENIATLSNQPKFL
jgi:hypothetical protein